MIRITVLIFLLLAITFTSGYSMEIGGVNLPETYPLQEQNLSLNGAGIREKFFLDIYAAGLYTSKPVHNAEALRSLANPAAIRMHFIYKKVDAEKIRDSFAEGFSTNQPAFAQSDTARSFLKIFDFDLVRGDTLDLVFPGGGDLMVRYNGSQIARFSNAQLALAVLDIYVGDHPVKGLKKALLAQ